MSTESSKEDVWSMENCTQLKKKICRVCKLEKSISEFYPDRRGVCKDGFRSDCRLCAKSIALKYIKEHKAERNAYRKFSPHGRFNSYKNDAKHSRIEFVLSFEEFMTLWQKSCVYCGSEVKTIGVDRIDSNGKYEISNVVACCGICNFMKKAMTTVEFITQCRKILDYYEKKA